MVALLALALALVVAVLAWTDRAQRRNAEHARRILARPAPGMDLETARLMRDATRREAA